MKSSTHALSIIVVLMLGFSQHALSNSNLQKIVGQEILEDQKNLVSKKLRPSSTELNSDTNQQNSIFDELTAISGEVLEIKLTTDLQHLIVNKNTKEYQLAFIEMEGANGNNVSHKLKVKPRGKYRHRICDFPPLKLNFSKDELIKHGLNPKFDKLKLVTHCTDNKAQAKDNVLREYLTYQIYNKLTDNSFRTQLVKIEYVDLHNSAKSMTRYGFLIEDTDEMATRLNGEICDCRGLEEEMISKTPYSMMAMFQYMIGNEDWDLLALRNVKAVQLKEGEIKTNIIVPYDFDFSGVVNAPYAIPNTNLKHVNIKQRHFSGDLLSAEELESVSLHFLNKRKEILQTVRKFKRLNADARIEIEQYLQEFFLILKNEKSSDDLFLKSNDSNLSCSVK